MSNTNAAEAPATVHICQCGCNQPIPWKPNHRFKAPTYLNHHAQRAPAFRAKWATSRAATYARPENAPAYTCQCGCNEEIPWRPAHAKRPPKFIQAHYLRNGTSLRITKLREAKLKTRMRPPQDWTPPSGYCECGCGGKTAIAKASDPARNRYAGFPMRFIRGHFHAALLKGGAAHLTRTEGRLERKFTKSGYVALLRPHHPTANKDGYVLEHRYVYETSRGITLPRHVLVHHIDGNRANNDPANLIATTRAKHTLIHMKAGEIIAIFLDKRLLRAAEAHFDTHGSLPDLEELTQRVYHDAASTG